MRASHGPADFGFYFSIGHCFPHGMESLRLLTRGKQTVRENILQHFFCIVTREGKMAKLKNDHRKYSNWKLIFLKSKVKGDFYRVGNFLLATPCLAGQRPTKAKFLTEIKEEVLILLEGK